MPIATADFFVAAEAAPWDGPDTVFDENLDSARLAALVAGPDPTHTDVDVSLALMDLVRDDLHLSNDHLINLTEMRWSFNSVTRSEARSGSAWR